ncbi:hypothetical protein DFQ26_003777 [Actinomortierella ambigua]|nr:hypothetical protein DFQ26_003777 [Actinomortierella ambigua]
MAKSILILALLALVLHLQVAVQASGMSTPLRIQTYLPNLFIRMDTVNNPDKPILVDSVSEDTGRVWNLEYSYPNNENVFLIRNWHTGDRITGRAAENTGLWGAAYEQSLWERVAKDDSTPNFFIQLVGTNLVWTLTEDHRVILTNRTGVESQLWDFQILV